MHPTVFFSLLQVAVVFAAPVAQESGIPGPLGVEYYQQNYVGGIFGNPSTTTNGTPPAVRPQYMTGGSGLYTANYTTHPTLANHTIYTPNNPPKFKLPIIVFANGACTFAGFRFSNLLEEIASHGYFIIANGPPQATGPSSYTRTTDLKASLDWVSKGLDGGKFGKLDTSRIAVMGQSCGGLEAYSASWKDDRVKLTVILNSGITNVSRTPLLSDLKVPIGYFLGGPGDVAYPNGERDYLNLPKGLPAFKGNLNVGHEATYAQPNGGLFGKVTRTFLDWQLKGDMGSKDLLLNSNSPYVADGWNFTSKNWGQKDDYKPKHCNYF